VEVGSAVRAIFVSSHIMYKKMNHCTDGELMQELLVILNFIFLEWLCVSLGSLYATELPMSQNIQKAFGIDYTLFILIVST
jgi:hypothetical protein